MRCITINYRYDGPEDEWRRAIDDFIAALDGDAEVAGRFNYQVATADDGVSRVHWGRWDSAETLKTMQSREYFRVFSERVRDFAGGPPQTLGAEVVLKTKAW